uniref:Uncharacterized protein n=1 Tax=Cucumis melo TaxID=3656 RepID=A0A9I9EK23_CUCME
MAKVISLLPSKSSIRFMAAQIHPSFLARSTPTKLLKKRF